MLLPHGDGTFTAGPLDVLCILHDATSGKFHAAFFEEAPFPGPIQDVREVAVVRLRCKMTHTGGALTLEGAQAQLADLGKRIHVVPQNYWSNSAEPWNGQLGPVLLRTNWRRGEQQ